MPDALLTLDGVHTHIGQYHILQGVDFAVPRGRHHRAARPQRRRQDHDAAHHHGPVEAVARAQVTFDGRDIGGLATPDIARAGIAYVPETHGHVRRPDGAREHGARRARRAARRGAAGLDLRLLPGAEDASGRIPAGVLSGGQKQMLSIARAIVEPRRLILIDEPTKGLAPAIIENMIRAFAELKRDGDHDPAGRAELPLRRGARRHRRGDGRRPHRARGHDGGAGRGYRHCRSGCSGLSLEAHQ